MIFKGIECGNRLTKKIFMIECLETMVTSVLEMEEKMSINIGRHKFMFSEHY